MDDLEFDTGLSARAFAQAKLAQLITEPGLIVRLAEAPPHRMELWKASGVREVNGADGRPTMVIWGPPVAGKRLATLLGEGQPSDKVLAAVLLWIQAVLALGEDTLENFPLWPSAAIVTQASEGRPPSVFFAPPGLAQRGVTADDEKYVNPALNGMAAAAFTAAVMLYRVIAGALPFSAANTSTLHEDMRDGNFLPIRFAVPGLDSHLATLIQSALEQGALEPAKMPFSSSACLASVNQWFDASLREAMGTAALVQPLSESDRLLLEKEKAQFLRKKVVSVKIGRFVARNTAPLLGVLAGVVAAAFIAYSMISARVYLPTTAGMEPAQVVESYYHGFGELNHQMMEACISGAAGKNDITAVINFFVINKTRQAYRLNVPPIVFPAHEWQGGDFPSAPLFGATDLRIEWLAGDTNSDGLRCRVDYTFWIPEQASGEEALSRDSPPPSSSIPYQRRDFLTLILIKGNWRIVEITRE